MAVTRQHEQSKRNEQVRKFSASAQEAIDRSADQGSDPVRLAEENLNRASDLGNQVADSAQQIMQMSVEMIARNTRAINDQVARSFGFDGEDSERLAGQSRQNTEAIARCGTVLTRAVQDAFRNSFELGQKRWQRNLEGLNKLTRAKSVQELAVLQSEVALESLQNFVQDTRAIAESSLRAIEEASKIVSSVKPLTMVR
ncbi:phasin family protein [Methylobacterium nodulans]|uniref:Phasin domain-containing protein n=1 Tax=Methylobacterium nodulans (strain LMG 21967 / CNCM I-2342 / ORS 2060) TaxID=460265 RepID=B8INA0_METNO|nr:phasin family protein [Methylobacterium nodulans]ACL56426.1 hypothetical protein Mnod_1429 [Methylobacterium nodulans ORS 2060]